MKGADVVAPAPNQSISGGDAMASHQFTPSQVRLKTILDYNPHSGIFTWKCREDVSKTWNTRFAGKQAGTAWQSGRTPYRVITVDYRHYYAHRLAWKIMTGKDPIEHVDHCNLDGLDNRFSNLREATNRQNLQNQRPRKKNGLKGVACYPLTSAGHPATFPYRAQISLEGKVTYLGSFRTAQEAHEMYCSAAREAFGTFARFE